MSVIKTLRSYKLFNFSIIDFVGTFIGAYFIAEFLHKKYQIPKYRMYYLIIPIGVLSHIVFSQKTPLNNMITNPNGDYIIKIILLFLIYKGIN
jgi:hypothetical protein